MNWQELVKADARWSGRLRLDGSQHRSRYVAAFFAHTGDSWFWLAALAPIWLFSQGEWRHRSALMAFGIVALAVCVLGIKFSIRRRRPEGEWGAVYRNTDPHSFPSGHAARSFMLATLAFGFGPPWFALALLIWAPLMSLARVVMGVHYLSDLLGGWFLGFITGILLLAIQPYLISFLPWAF